jgi:hypothetical protein
MAFSSGFEKVAFLKQKHVESYLGMIPDAKHSPEIRKLIDEQKQNRFALRHPILTGIPTLGMWPLASRVEAAEEVAHEMLRRHSVLREAKAELDAEEHRREVDLMKKHIAEREASSREAMMSMGSSAALGIAGHIADAVKNR